jgi:serine/threonine protein kinase
MPSTTDRKVADRYALSETLGRGGMGTVWRAQDGVLKRPVAVKEVRLPETLSESDKDSMRERVLREARTAARLNHANVVTVYDVVKEDGHVYIVMELVDAPTLDEVVSARGPLSPEETARVGLAVLGALEAAHAEGITHRDVKPGNVMLPDGGTAKLADFGIAALKGDPKITATGLILGSPSYMAPEQASKDTSGPESDLWALGATLYYAVEGEPPFDRGQAIPTLTAVVHEDPRPVTKAGPMAPVIERLLAKEPGERPTAAELRRMLEGIASGAPPVDTQEETAAFTPVTQTRAFEPSSGPTSLVQTPARQRTAVPSRSDRRSGAWLIALGLIALLAIAAALVIPKLTSGSDDETGGGRKGAKDRGSAGAAADPATDPTDPSPSTAPAETGWTTYEGSNGFSVDYPEGWEVVEGSVDGDSVDFRAPEGDRYLRVDWTDSPGPDAAAAWEDASESFGSSHDNYEEVRIEETSFADSDNAAEWEATWTEGGASLHMIDLGFVTPDGAWGFALNWVANEDVWADSLADFERAKSTFVAP